MSPEIIQRITSGVSALAIFACLAVGTLAFSSNAEARVKGPRNTEQAQICGWIQDQWDLWTQNYHNADFGSAAEAEALDMMESLLAGWGEEGCDRDYGSIGVRPAPITKVKNVGVVTNTSR
jgi:hypothetical protein